MLYRHYLEAPWDPGRWPNFSPREMACRHCGELFWWPEAFDAIQQVRSLLDQPVFLHSAHRCPIHNALIGGAPHSMHLQIAFDIQLEWHERSELLAACREAGFCGFGYYATFLHVDIGRERFWFGGGAGEARWSSVI